MQNVFFCALRSSLCEKQKCKANKKQRKFINEEENPHIIDMNAYDFAMEKRDKEHRFSLRAAHRRMNCRYAENEENEVSG